MITFVPHTENVWREVSPGVEFCDLRAHGEDDTGETHGTTVLVRMARGAHAPHHHHPGGEETFIVSGRLRIGDHELAPGDYLWTPPGVVHDGVAAEETVFFVVLPRGLRPQKKQA